MIHLNNEFDLLEENEKIEYIRKYPERILLIDIDDVKSIEKGGNLKDLVLLNKLKTVAIQNCGELILYFEENGFSINNALIKKAFKSAPYIGKYCDKSWLTEKNLHYMIRDDLNNYDYIPSEWLDNESPKSKRMIKYLQKNIRARILENPAKYKDLPSTLTTKKHSNFTSLNAYTDGNMEYNVLKVHPNIWESNGGKILFKIARKNVDLALKLLSITQRRTLAIALLDININAYDKFPESLKFQKKVRLKLYSILRGKNDINGIDKYFNQVDKIIYEKKYKANIKRKNTIIKKKAEGTYKRKKNNKEKENEMLN